MNEQIGFLQKNVLSLQFFKHQEIIGNGIKFDENWEFFCEIVLVKHTREHSVTVAKDPNKVGGSLSDLANNELSIMN
jgi:hypothetical protein